jgi:hypothetical protein
VTRPFIIYYNRRKKGHIIMVMNQERKEECDDYYSKAERDRNRIIEIIAKSRKPLLQ